MHNSEVSETSCPDGYLTTTCSPAALRKRVPIEELRGASGREDFAALNTSDSDGVVAELTAAGVPRLLGSFKWLQAKLGATRDVLRLLADFREYFLLTQQRQRLWSLARQLADNREALAKARVPEEERQQQQQQQATVGGNDSWLGDVVRRTRLLLSCGSRGSDVDDESDNALVRVLCQLSCNAFSVSDSELTPLTLPTTTMTDDDGEDTGE